jgi:tetratricopeptide (TPR) repeat protein
MLQMKPQSAEGHFNMGIALEQAGRIKEAIEQYEQALSPRPDFAELQKRIEQLRSILPKK